LTKCGKDPSPGLTGHQKFLKNLGNIISFGVTKVIGIIKNNESFNEQRKVTGTIKRDFLPAKIECHILPTFAPLKRK
jgi:hypothetical protein